MASIRESAPISTDIAYGLVKGAVFAGILAFAAALGGDPGMRLDEDRRFSISGPPTIQIAGAGHLLTYYSALGFILDDVREGRAAVPAIVAHNLPHDTDAIRAVDQRKRLFIKTVLPLILQVNDRIARDRARIEVLRDRLVAGGDMLPQDAYWLGDRARAYGVPRDDIDALLARVDGVPPSLALAQAAIESGWGTSRFAREGQALFGQEVYRDSVAQMAPRNGEEYRIRAFDNLIDSVRTYVHNLNRHAAYADFRKARSAMRLGGKPLDAVALAGHLELYSARGADYVADIRIIMRQNNLSDFDSAKLSRQPGRRLYFSS